MNSDFRSGVAMPSSSANFLSATWGYFALALGICAIGVFAAPHIFTFFGMNMMVMWGIFFATLGLIFTARSWSTSQTWGIPMFSLFAFLMGVSTFPLIDFAIGEGLSGLITKALVSTVCVFTAAAIWGHSTQKDLSGWGSFLMMSLIGLIVVGILQIFWFSNTVEMIASGFAVLVFSGYTAYDMQNIKRGLYPNPLFAAMSLFLNFILMFRNMLRLLISLSND